MGVVGWSQVVTVAELIAALTDGVSQHATVRFASDGYAHDVELVVVSRSGAVVLTHHNAQIFGAASWPAYAQGSDGYWFACSRSEEDARNEQYRETELMAAQRALEKAKARVEELSQGRGR